MIYIHAGFAKSATTSLQQNLFPHLDGVIYLGRPYNGGLIQNVVNQITRYDALEYSREKCLKDTQQFFSTIGADTPVLLSDEFFTAPDLPIDRSLVAQRIADVIAPTKILFTIRSQYTAVPSLYAQWRAGKRFSQAISQRRFNKYLSAHLHREATSEAIYFDYWKPIKLYIDIFGRENVEVLTFESFLADKLYFENRVRQFLGIAAVETPIKIAKNNAKPARLSSFGRSVVRTATKTKSAIMPWFHPKRGLLGGVIGGIEQTMFNLGGVPDLHIPSEATEKFTGLFSNGNRALDAEFNLNLSTCGYPI